MKQNSSSKNKNELNYQQKTFLDKNSKETVLTMKEYLKLYYLKDFHRVVETTNRPLGLSLLLLCIYKLQLVSLYFTEDTIAYLNQKDQLMYGIYQILNQFKAWTILTTVFNLHNPWEYIIVFQTVLNISLLILVFIGFVVCSYKRKQEARNVLVTLPNYVQLFLRMSERYTSFILSIYTFVFHMIFQHSNLKVFLNTGNSDQIYIILAIMNIPLTISIGFTAVMHDYSYSYKPKDLLAQSQSLKGLLGFAQEFILCLLYQANVSWFLWVVCVFIHMRLILYTYSLPYYSAFISKVYFAFIFLNWLIWFSNLLYEIDSVREAFNMGFIFIGCIPLFWKIPSYLYNAKISSLLFDKNLSNVNQRDLELYCRNIAKFVDLDQFEYMKDAKGITFEMVYTDHISNCTELKCFCKEFIQSKDTHTYSSAIQLNDQLKRFEFLCLLITQTYSDFFRKHVRQINKYKKLQYSYLHFIIEIMHIPTKSFVEIIHIRSHGKNVYASINEQYITENLMRLANTEFSRFWEKSEIQNQRLDMMSVIDFSDLNLYIGKNLKLLLNMKRDVLQFLNTDFIDLTSLVTKGSQYVQSRDQLEKQITDAFDIHPHSRQSYFYAEIYCENFDIKQRKIHHFIKNSKLKLLKQLKKEDYGINIFKQRSCMVLITLLNPIGYIRRVSSSFEQLFGVKQFNSLVASFFLLTVEQLLIHSINLKKTIDESQIIFDGKFQQISISPIKPEEAVGKSCNFMMPEVVAGIHDDCLKYFVERGNLHNLKKGIIFGFGRRKNGFMFAIHARTKLILEKLNDFGVVGHFEEVNHDYDYFLCEPEGGIFDVTERIYAYCFYDMWKLDKKKIENLDACRMIPLLAYQILTEKKVTQTLHYQTLMCVPITQKMMSQFRKTSQKFDPVVDMVNLLSKFQQFDQFIFLDVNLRYEQIDTAIGASVKFVEITRFKRIRKESEIIESLNQLKQDLSKLLDIPINLKYLAKQQNNQINKSKTNVNSIQPFELVQIDSMQYNNDIQKNLDYNSKNYAQRGYSQDDEERLQVSAEHKIQQIQQLNTSPLKNSKPEDVIKEGDQAQEHSCTVSMNERKDPSMFKFGENQIDYSALQFDKIIEDSVQQYQQGHETYGNGYEQMLSPKFEYLLSPRNEFDTDRSQANIMFSKRDHQLETHSGIKQFENKHSDRIESEFNKHQSDNGILKALKQTEKKIQQLYSPYKSGIGEDISLSQSRIENKDYSHNIGIQMYQDGSPSNNDFKQQQNHQRRLGSLSFNNSQVQMDNTLLKNNDQKVSQIEINLQSSLALKSNIQITSQHEVVSPLNSTHNKIQTRPFKQQSQSTNVSSQMNYNIASTIDQKYAILDESHPQHQLNGKLNLEKQSKFQQQNCYSGEKQIHDNQETESSIRSQRHKNIQFISSARQCDDEDEEIFDEDINNATNTFKNTKDNILRQIDRQSSVRSANSDFQSRKQAVIEEIMQKKPPKVAAVFINLGKFTGLILLIMCIIQFVISNQQITTVQKSNRIEESIPLFINNYLKIINNIELIRIVDGFGFSISQQQGFNKTQLQTQAMSYLETFKLQMNNFHNQDNTVSGVEFMNSDKVETVFTGEYAFVQSASSSLDSFITSFQSFFYYAYAYISNLSDNPRVQIPIYSNFLPQINSLIDFYSISYDDTMNTFDNLTSDVFILFGITCIISFLSIIITLPINISVESKKEDLLKLICTFPPEKLSFYLQNTEKAILQANDNQQNIIKEYQTKTNQKQQNGGTQNTKKLKETNTNQQNNLTYLSKVKKKTISQTSQLNKFNFSSFLLSLLTFFLILIQPITIFSIIQNKVKIMKDSYSILQTLIYDNFHVNQLFSSAFLQMSIIRTSQNSYYSQLLPPDLRSDYMSFYSNLITNITTVNNKMYTIQQQIQNNDEVSQSSKNVFIQLLNSDLCLLTPIYLAQLNLQDQYQNYIPCNTQLYQYSLQQGIVLTQNKLESIFANIQTILQDNSYNNFVQDITLTNQLSSFPQMVTAQQNLDLSINIINTIIYEAISGDISYLLQLNVALFSIQLVIIITVFYFLWQDILSNIKNSFFQVKYLLTIFSIDQILENSYLSNYLQKSNKETKNI